MQQRWRIFYFSWLVFMGLSWVGITPVRAEVPSGQVGEVVFTDDFSQGLAKWQVARGAATIWRSVDGKVEGLVPGQNTISELVPKPEFWNPAWRNYEYEVDMLPMAGADRNFAWGYQDLSNWYEVHLLTNLFELARKQNGFVAWYRGQNFSFNNTWHHLKIRTAGGKLDFWIDEALVYSYTESNYSENPGTIALKVGTGLTAPTQVQFDNVQVRLVADPRSVDLVVPAVRQDDSTWANQTYDHAEKWAGQEATTLRRWGCALTSAVMVLRFHGFTQLIDGSLLTPASLNNWLLSQPDGYIADGWVNWIALVRLARELREKFSTTAQPLPQLSYVYQTWPDWAAGATALKAELNQQRPVILELPNHFIVARGYTFSSTDWLIRDPASAADQLSQLQKIPTSARLFQTTSSPYLLDLSYWVIVFRKGLRVRVLDDQDRQIMGWWASQDKPGDLTSNSGESTPDDWVAMTLPHPPSGQFTLEIGRATGHVAEDGLSLPTANLPALVPFELQVFYYDHDARVMAWHQTGSLAQDFPRWRFSTGDGQTLPTLETQFSWTDWRTSLRQMEADQKLPRLAISRLDQVAQLAVATEQQTLNNSQLAGDDKLLAQRNTNQRYAAWLKNILDQIPQTWPSLHDSPEIGHLQNQLGRWLDSAVSN